MFGLDYSWLLDPTYQQWLLQGVVQTLELAALSSVIAIAIGLAGALGLTFKIAWLDALIELFVELFRNTPPLLQMLFFYFTLTQIGFTATDPVTGLQVPLVSAFASATVSLSLFGGALCIEAFRSGFDAVPKATLEAARSLGYSRWGLFVHVQAPIASRICLPPLTNVLTNLFKTTSQASVITVPELMYAAGQIYNDTFRTLEVMLLVLLIYVVLVSLLVWFIGWVERRLAYPGYGG
ncbi:amino acid ABC transporter permease [Erwinia billingiae]|jgi:polar amino acid transport system permease protein|uniref:amino acid ABC transporter permease n=1 Tax=Erwinia billingiae TaxID=182337 RepID=UPI000CFFE753|nr:amino acid ABC transporter permease [Erwinia billingiae]PRB59420.1 amino acid ABC transporter permease [Erwinia billingiae]